MPLTSLLAQGLVAWRDARRATAEDPVFTYITDKTADMLRRDLEAAEIPEKDADGRVADFHALRHTFISRLARAGIHPKVAQDLARHSTITLTLNRYTHTLMEERAAAVAKLPALPLPSTISTASPIRLAKTGTDDL